MTALDANLIALAIGFVLALVLAGVGALHVAKLGLALKKRVKGYREIPLMEYLPFAKRKVAQAMSRIDALPALAYRANAALSDIANARAKIVTIATSPSALWRLGELVVIGK